VERRLCLRNTEMGEHSNCRRFGHLARSAHRCLEGIATIASQWLVADAMREVFVTHAV
jgi:hypothetical protein